MKHFRAQIGSDLGQGFRQQFVQRFCAQASAKDQQTRFAAGQSRSRCFEEQLAAHRVSGGTAGVRQSKGVGERFTHPGGERHQQPIGGAGHSVLLVNDHRHAGQFRGEATRASHITTEADHTHRLQATNDCPRLPYRFQQHERRLEQRQLALAAQAGGVDAVQFKTCRGHQFVFNSAWRAEPVHGVAARLKLASTGQRREHVAAGSAGHDQYVSAHDSAPRRSRSHGIPSLHCPGGFDSPTQSSITNRGRHSRSPTSCRHN
ncbi:hypothetical protein D3C85_985970 [compost metagenome]